MGGGVVTPQPPSPPLAAPLQPKTEPRQLNFGFCSPAAPRLTFRERGAPPPPPPQPHNCTTSPHHPPPFDTAHPESSHRAQIRGIWLCYGYWDFYPHLYYICVFILSPITPSHLI